MNYHDAHDLEQYRANLNFANSLLPTINQLIGPMTVEDLMWEIGYIEHRSLYGPNFYEMGLYMQSLITAILIQKDDNRDDHPSGLYSLIGPLIAPNGVMVWEMLCQILSDHQEIEPIEEVVENRFVLNTEFLDNFVDDLWRFTNWWHDIDIHPEWEQNIPLPVVFLDEEQSDEGSTSAAAA